MKTLIFIPVMTMLFTLYTGKATAQNYLASKKETVTFVIDLTGSKFNSNIKNDFSTLNGIELSSYCERPDLKQALMILKIDRTIHSDNNAIELFWKHAGVTAKSIGDINTIQLQQHFCQ